ncbi:MAG: hypothetical protein AAF539_11795 [Planctomycetota bacterium]
MRLRLTMKSPISILTCCACVLACAFCANPTDAQQLPNDLPAARKTLNNEQASLQDRALALRLIGMQGNPADIETIESLIKDPHLGSYAATAAERLSNDASTAIKTVPRSPATRGTFIADTNALGTLIDRISEANESEASVIANQLATLGGALSEGESRAVLQARMSDASPELARQLTLALARAGHFDEASDIPDVVLSLPGDAPAQAIAALASVQSAKLDDSVIERLNHIDANDSESVIVGLIRYASSRRLGETSKSLLNFIKTAETAVANEAVLAMGQVVAPETWPSVLATLIQPGRDDLSTQTIDGSLVTACVRLPAGSAAKAIATQIKQASAENRIRLVNLLAVLGGDEALAEIDMMIDQGDSDSLDLATRALGEWPSPDALSQLDPLITMLPPGNKYRTRALRALLRIGRQIDLPADQLDKLIRRGYGAANRDDERKLAIGIVTQKPTIDRVRWLIDQHESASTSQAVRITIQYSIRSLFRRLPVDDHESARRLAAEIDPDLVTPKLKTLFADFRNT